jgi:hypothetical protein
MTPDEERKHDLFRELRAREFQFDHHNPKDVAGRSDILHSVRRVEGQLRELGYRDYEPEYRERCRNEAVAEEQRKQALRERAYAKTGIVQND